MITLKLWLEELRRLVRAPGSLGIFALLYAVFLATLFLFISTREATVAQVAVTYLCLALIPVAFFILQAAIIDQTREHKFHWARIAVNALKIAVVTIPIILLGYLLFYLLNKWQLHYPAPKPPVTFGSAPPPVSPTHRPTLIFATLRCLIFGVVLPLLTIHFWIEVVGNEVRTLLNKTVLKRLGRVLGRAFAFDSTLTYAIGLVFFVAIPYAALFVPFSVKGNKTEFVVFIGRLLLAFIFTLIGWIVTLGALAGANTIEPPLVVAPAAAEAPA